MPNALVSPDILTKHPDESLTYSVDFSNVLDTGESLTGVNGSIEQDQDEMLTFGTPEVIGTTIVFRVQAGTAGIDYRVTVEAQTSEANVRAVIGVLLVRD